jgi:hypothetical protein
MDVLNGVTIPWAVSGSFFDENNDASWNRNGFSFHPGVLISVWTPTSFVILVSGFPRASQPTNLIPVVCVLHITAKGHIAAYCFVNPFATTTFLGAAWWWWGGVGWCKECESTKSHAVKVVCLNEK